MKNKNVMITPHDIASFSFKKGYSLALSWVKEIAELYDDPKARQALAFVADQLAEGQEDVHANFMENLKVESLDMSGQTQKLQ